MYSAIEIIIILKNYLNFYVLNKSCYMADISGYTAINCMGHVFYMPLLIITLDGCLYLSYRVFVLSVKFAFSFFEFNISETY
jgi:hypothetical protein